MQKKTSNIEIQPRRLTGLRWMLWWCQRFQGAPVRCSGQKEESGDFYPDADSFLDACVSVKCPSFG